MNYTSSKFNIFVNLLISVLLLGAIHTKFYLEWDTARQQQTQLVAVAP